MSGSSDSPGSDPFAPSFEDWQRRCFEYTLTGKNKPPYPNIDMLWRSFEKSLGGGLHPTILNLTKQGFYGGALGFLFLITKSGEVWGEEEGNYIVQKLEAELTAFMASQASALGVTVPGTSSIIQ